MALRARRRAGEPQVREPPAHRFLQGSRGLRPDRAALAGGERPRSGGSVSRQPRPRRGSRRDHAGDRVHGVHARGRPHPQGEGDPGLRRGGGLPRPLPRGLPRGGAAPSPRRPARSSSTPSTTSTSSPVRGRSDSRSWSRRPTYARCWCPPVAGDCWPGSRSRSRRCARTYAWSASRPRGPPPIPGRSLPGEPVALESMSTMADGIAVGRPGDITFAAVRDHVDDIITVSEESLSRALLAIVERAKQVVEPAGAAGVAALLDNPEGFETPAVAVLSGGNIDPLLLSKVIRHGLAAAGRYLYLRVCIPDLPGGLASLLGEVGAAGANVLEVAHERLSPSPDPQRGRGPHPARDAGRGPRREPDDPAARARLPRLRVGPRRTERSSEAGSRRREEASLTARMVVEVELSPCRAPRRRSRRRAPCRWARCRRPSRPCSCR